MTTQDNTQADASITSQICRFGGIYAEHHPPLTSRFDSEVEKYWGRRWGVNTEVGRLRSVLVHRPGPEIDAIADPLVKWRYTEKPRLPEMVAAHERLVAALRGSGVEVVVRNPETAPSPRLVQIVCGRRNLGRRVELRIRQFGHHRHLWRGDRHHQQ